MKVAKRTAQALASIAVLSLLMSGSVFAYSANLSHISSYASPLAADNPPATTSTSSTTEDEENNQVTQNSQTVQTGEIQGEHTLEFKLVPVGTAAGKGDAELQVMGTDIRVDLQIEQAPKSTTYGVVLSTTATSPSCTDPIGTLVTSDEGQAEAKLSYTLSPGTYSVGLLLCVGTTPSLQSDPATQTAIISPAATESQTEQTNQVNTKEEDKQEQDEIKGAEDSKVIPAVVSVSGSGAALTQLDPKFSVSVSRPGDNQLSVSISGTNVTGPRVLLINVTKDAGALSSLGALSVTYDGNQISEASTLSQIFSGTSTSPPSYLVLITSSGVQLLVFIPHFSSHLIQLMASPALLGTFVAQAPLLLAGFAAVAAASAALYARRKRFTAPAAL